MNWKAISRNVGLALLVSSLFMFLSLVISLIDGKDSAFGPLLISCTITFLVGVFPLIFVRKAQRISLKEGYVMIVLSWLLSFVFGMLPYAMWGGPFSLSNAWFESVSGFTTTGATILSDVESIPRSLLFWRSSTHFIGGLGVVVFLLLVIPASSPVRLRLTNMELSSLSKGSYSTSSNRTVYVFAYVYLFIALAAFVSYLLCGMSVFDAVNHAMSVCATGGFSTRNLSIAAFDSRAVELCTVVFMILSSLHFGLLYLCFVKRSLKPMKNPVTMFFLSALLVFTLVIALSLKLSGSATGWGESLWCALFQTVCVASTTGFAVADNASWPLLANVMLMFAAIMCGCAGSTTGGVKADRVLVLFKSMGLQLKKILHPSSVYELKLGGRLFREEDVSPHILYIAIYFVFLAVSMFLVLLCGVSGSDAFSASVSCLGNVGPAIGDLGTMGNFNHLPAMSKFIFSLDMFFGRVEIYPILAMFAMGYEKIRSLK